MHLTCEPRLLPPLAHQWRVTDPFDPFLDALARAGPTLVQIAQRTTGNIEVAEDLAQQTLLAALRGRGHFDGRRDLLPWLVGILRNRIRRLRAERRLPTVVSGTVEVASKPGDPIEERERRRALTKAVGQLPSEDRRILAMRYVHDLNSTQIGALLSLPPSTVRGRIERALGKLRYLTAAS